MGGAREVKKRGVEDAPDTRVERAEGGEPARVSPHLQKQGGASRASDFRKIKSGDAERGLAALGAKRSPDVARDAARFNEATKGNARLGLKGGDVTRTEIVSRPSGETSLSNGLRSVWDAVAGFFHGIGVYFGWSSPAGLRGEVTQVTPGEAGRASVAAPDAVTADAAATARGHMLLSAYSFQNGYEGSMMEWGGNGLRVRLENLARSPFADLPVVQEAKATLEALERLRQDPADAKALAQAESWFRWYDGRNRDVTELDRQVHRAEEERKAVEGVFGELRVTVEEPLITQVAVYWEGSVMFPGLVSLRESGAVLGVDVRYVSAMDIAAARLEGRTDIPVGEIDIWTSERGDPEAVQDAVLRALPEGFTLRIPESTMAFSASTGSRLVFTAPGFGDLRFIVNIGTPPSVMVDAAAGPLP